MRELLPVRCVGHVLFTTRRQEIPSWILSESATVVTGRKGFSSCYIVQGSCKVRLPRRCRTGFAGKRLTFLVSKNWEDYLLHWMSQGLPRGDKDARSLVINSTLSNPEGLLLSRRAENFAHPHTSLSQRHSHGCRACRRRSQQRLNCCACAPLWLPIRSLKDLLPSRADLEASPLYRNYLIPSKWTPCMRLYMQPLTID